MQNYVSTHIGREDEVTDVGLTRRLYDGGPFITTVKVGELTITTEPRVLRRIAQDLLDAADKAVKRQDEQESEPLFEAVQ